MRNKLSDLNDALFEQLERLNDDEWMEEHPEELDRSRAIVSVSGAIVDVHRTAISAARTMDAIGYGSKGVLALAEGQ